MDLPKAEDLVSCGDSEYLENLARLLFRAGFGLSGVFVGVFDEFLHAGDLVE